MQGLPRVTTVCVRQVEPLTCEQNVIALRMLSLHGHSVVISVIVFCFLPRSHTRLSSLYAVAYARRSHVTCLTACTEDSAELAVSRIPYVGSLKARLKERMAEERPPVRNCNVTPPLSPLFA